MLKSFRIYLCASEANQELKNSPALTPCFCLYCQWSGFEHVQAMWKAKNSWRIEWQARKAWRCKSHFPQNVMQNCFCTMKSSGKPNYAWNNPISLGRQICTWVLGEWHFRLCSAVQVMMWRVKRIVNAEALWISLTVSRAGLLFLVVSHSFENLK